MTINIDPSDPVEADHDHSHRIVTLTDSIATNTSNNLPLRRQVQELTSLLGMFPDSQPHAALQKLRISRARSGDVTSESGINGRFVPNE
jgi:hypothetical protein